MAEGWLFRLRTSLGSQYTAPAWPSVHGAEAAAPAPGLRRQLPARLGDEPKPAVESPEPTAEPRKSDGC